MTASDGVTGDKFGCSVSISGDYVILGANQDDDNGLSSGSAYVFTRSGSTWIQQAKILPLYGVTYGYFGNSVSLDGDTAIIGARGDDYNGYWAGSAYIFTRSGTNWTEEQKLLASDGVAYDYFGCSVSIDGEYAIVGVYGADDEKGSAYVFNKPIPILIPDLDCDGSLSWTNVTSGDTVTGSFTVENIGDPESLLDWEIESYPDWGNWTFTSESGIDLLAGETEEIDVEIIAPDEQEETFTGEVVLVNIEDPDDTCVIDVSLATPVSHQSLISLFFEKLAERFPFLALILEVIF